MSVHPPLLTERDAEVPRRLAAAIGQAGLAPAWTAYEQACIAGLCHEGAWEVALGTRVAGDARHGHPASPAPRL